MHVRYFTKEKKPQTVTLRLLPAIQFLCLAMMIDMQ